MKKLILAAAVGCVIATPAFADDEDDWTGAYVGVSVGYTSAESDTSTVLSGSWASESAALQSHVTNNFAASQSIDDVNFGGQIGYNYHTGGAVLGVEVDIAALSGDSVVSRGPLAVPSIPALSYTFTNRVDPKHMIALKARAGGVMGNTLLYVEGGWAFTRADLGADILSNGGYSKSGRLTETMDGFIVGGGIEHRFSPNVSARIAYNYADQGDASYVNAYNPGSAFAPPGANYVETMTQDLRMHLVRVGLNFHF